MLFLKYCYGLIKHCRTKAVFDNMTIPQSRAGRVTAPCQIGREVSPEATEGLLPSQSVTAEQKRFTFVQTIPQSRDEHVTAPCQIGGQFGVHKGAKGC